MEPFLCRNTKRLDPKSVRFTQRPFLEFHETLIEPSLLKPKLGKDVVSNQFFNFTIPSKYIERFSGQRNDGTDVLPRYEILLRMCIVENDTEQEDAFPHSIFIEINQNNVRLPPFIKYREHDGSDIETDRRPPKAVNVTSACMPFALNKKYTVNVIWKHIGESQKYSEKHFMIGLWIVKTNNVDILYDRLLGSLPTCYEETKNKLKRDFVNTDPNKLLPSQISFETRCPVSFGAIKIPVRSKDCTHISCFDLRSYLEMCEKSNKWNCPTCSKKAYPNDLIIDKYIEEIIKEVGNTPKKVEISLQLSYRVVTEDEKPKKSLVNAIRIKREPIDDTQIESSSVQEMTAIENIDGEISSVANNKDRLKENSSTLNSENNLPISPSSSKRPSPHKTDQANKSTPQDAVTSTLSERPIRTVRKNSSDPVPAVSSKSEKKQFPHINSSKSPQKKNSTSSKPSISSNSEKKQFPHINPANSSKRPNTDPVSSVIDKRQKVTHNENAVPNFKIVVDEVKPAINMVWNAAEFEKVNKERRYQGLPEYHNWSIVSSDLTSYLDSRNNQLGTETDLNKLLNELNAKLYNGKCLIKIESLEKQLRRLQSDLSFWSKSDVQRVLKIEPIDQQNSNKKLDDILNKLREKYPEYKSIIRKDELERRIKLVETDKTRKQETPELEAIFKDFHIRMLFVMSMRSIGEPINVSEDELEFDMRNKLDALFDTEISSPLYKTLKQDEVFKRASKTYPRALKKNALENILIKNAFFTEVNGSK